MVTASTTYSGSASRERSARYQARQLLPERDGIRALSIILVLATRLLAMWAVHVPTFTPKASFRRLAGLNSPWASLSMSRRQRAENRQA